MHWTGVSDGLCICLWWLFVGIEICDSSLCDSIFSHSYIHRVHTNIHIIHHNTTHIIHHNKHPHHSSQQTPPTKSTYHDRTPIILRQEDLLDRSTTVLRQRIVYNQPPSSLQRSKLILRNDGKNMLSRINT